MLAGNGFEHEEPESSDMRTMSRAAFWGLLAISCAVVVLSAVGLLPGEQGDLGESHHEFFVGFSGTALIYPPFLPPHSVLAKQVAINPRGVVRFAIQWRVAQPDPAVQPSFDDYDDYIVEPAQDLGLKPLISIMAAPPWAWGSGQCDPYYEGARGYCIMPPGDDALSLRGWTEFVRAVVRHYGDEAVGIEIWNEQNIGAFWNTTGGPDPQHYARVLCTAWNVVKDEHPGMPIVLGGLAAPPETTAERMSISDFLSGLYDAGGSHCMDAIGIHPYPGAFPPDAPEGGFLRSLAETRATRDANDDAHRPIWITEVGYTNQGPAGVSEQEQALWLLCALRMAAAMPDIGAFIIHTLVDGGHAEGPVEAAYGVYRTPLPSGAIVPKPAATGLQLLLTEGADSVPPAIECDGSS